MPKTIFGTTEESNFILNLRDDTVERLPLLCAKLLIVLLSVGQAVPEVVETVGRLTGHGSDLSYGFLNSPFMCLAVVWVVAIVALVVMVVRGRTVRRLHLPLGVLLVAGVAWATVSATQSFSSTDAINGLYGRTTGVLTLASCATVLLLMSYNSRESSAREVVRLTVVASTVQCGWSALQMLSRLSGSSLYYYSDLNNVAVKNVCLPCGFSGSPILYAEYLGLVLALALVMACLERSRLCTVVCAVYGFFIVSTHTLAGLIGLGTVVLAGVVLLVVKRVRYVLPVVLSVVGGAVAFGLACVLDGSYTLYDGAIVWQDSFYRLGTTGYYWSPDAGFDVYSVRSVLSYIWSGCLQYVRLFPLVGTGADCLVLAQMGSYDSTSYVVNGYDLAYDDYLQVASTMGIPALVLYVATLVLCLVRVVKRVRSGGGSVYVGVLVATVAYLVLSVVCSTTIYVMPYVCVLLGLATSKDGSDTARGGAHTDEAKEPQ